MALDFVSRGKREPSRRMGEPLRWRMKRWAEISVSGQVSHFNILSDPERGKTFYGYFESRPRRAGFHLQHLLFQSRSIPAAVEPFANSARISWTSSKLLPMSSKTHSNLQRWQAIDKKDCRFSWEHVGNTRQ